MFANISIADICLWLILAILRITPKWQAKWAINIKIFLSWNIGIFGIILILISFFWRYKKPWNLTSSQCLPWSLRPLIKPWNLLFALVIDAIEALIKKKLDFSFKIDSFKNSSWNIWLVFCSHFLTWYKQLELLPPKKTDLTSFLR